MIYATVNIMFALKRFADLRRSSVLVLSLCLPIATQACLALQTVAFKYPSHLPYRFENFVWWNDDNLRTELKKRIPGLTDEIETSNAGKARVRAALQALLKEKGVSAEVMSEEPGPSAFAKLDPRMFGGHPPEQPHPAITFRISSPSIVIGKLELKDIPPELDPDFQKELDGLTGRTYTESSLKFTQQRLLEISSNTGYLDAKVQVEHLSPLKQGDKYAVDLNITLNAGERYRVGTINANGGPLLEGKDLSRFYTLKPGDNASHYPFGHLGPQLRAFYTNKGYADVSVDIESHRDASARLVSYQLTVNPGPVYHLRTLNIQHLDSAQEARVREIISIKPGDVYDEEATTRVYHALANEPLLKGLDFSFSPLRDQNSAFIDLTLNFYKEGGEATVSVR